MARITYRKTRKGETITMRADKGEDLRSVVAEMAKPATKSRAQVETGRANVGAQRAASTPTLTLDTITDEQIRDLLNLLQQLMPEIETLDTEAHAEAAEDAELCRLALYDTEALSRQARSDWHAVHREARARCAEILNARAKAGAS